MLAVEAPWPTQSAAPSTNQHILPTITDYIENSAKAFLPDGEINLKAYTPLMVLTHRDLGFEPNSTPAQRLL